MPQNNMAVGSKVYNGGSNTAQRGQSLDPSGYIQRNLQQAAQQRFQNTGPANLQQPGTGAVPSQPGAASQQRSGLAQNQLSQMNAPGAQPMGGGDPNVGGLAPFNNAQMAQANPMMNQVKAFDASALPNFGAQTPTVKIPGVPSSVTGQLKSPLDADLRQQRDLAYNSLNESLTGLQSALEQMSAEYQSSVRDFGTDSQRAYRDLANMFASMGGGAGTAYGQDYGDLTSELTNFRNDLDTSFTRGQQDLLKDRTNALNRFQSNLRGTLGQQTERDAKRKADAALKKSQAAKAKKSTAKPKAAAKPKASSSYTIKKGDTLSAIAKKNNTTVAKLMKLNPHIKDKNKIYYGQGAKSQLKLR